MRRPLMIDAHGTRTRYFDEGSGETVVLVHGGRMASANSASDWDRNFADLARDHRVVALDMIGQGHSDNPVPGQGYTINSPADHLHRFVQALGLERFHLVGHSGGAYQSTKFTLAHPEMVTSLTIGDSGSFTQAGSRRSEEIAAAAAKIDDPRSRYVYELTATAYGPDLMSEVWIDDIMSYAQTTKFDQARAYMAEFGAAVKQGHAEDQALVQAAVASGRLKDLPVQLIWAFNDTNAPLERCGIPTMNLFLQAVPNARMHVLNQSGHYVMRERAEEFNQLVRAFVDTVTRQVGHTSSTT